MRTLTCPPEAETLGANARAFFANLRDYETKPIMEKYNLVDVAPDEWFPSHQFLDALNELATTGDITSNLVAIGMEIGGMTPLPPGMEDPTLEDVLTHWNEMYQMLHRNGDVGTIVAEKVGDKHLKTIHTDMYPDDLSYGIVYGYGRRFLPPGTHFTVKYDEELPPRDRGGDGPTIIHITWE